MAYEFFTNLIPIIIGFLGLIVGSFLNVVILRHNTNKGIDGRSKCPHCNKTLSWYELIPVLSYVVQWGRCRSCRVKISPQYALVEIITGILFYFSALYIVRNFFSPFIETGVFVAALVALLVMVSFAIIISVYDLRTQLIPFSWFIGLVVSSIIFLGIDHWTLDIIQFSELGVHLLGLLVAIPFFIAWLISRGKWMGFGDIEIIAWMGFYFGMVMGLSAVLTAYYLGAIFAILYIIYHTIRGKSYTDIRKNPIPFAPFLLFAWFVSVAFSWNVFSLFAAFIM